MERKAIKFGKFAADELNFQTDASSPKTLGTRYHLAVFFLTLGRCHSKVAFCQNGIPFLPNGFQALEN